MDEGAMSEGWENGESKYEPGYAEQARKLCELGATDCDLAYFFEVTDRTIRRWKIAHPEFAAALKAGKAIADDAVEERLYQRAMGYSHDAVKIFLPKDETTPVYAPYREHYPPDVTACIFWLKNRRPEKWRDKQEHDLTHRLEASLLEFMSRIDGDSAGLPVKP